MEQKYIQFFHRFTVVKLHNAPNVAAGFWVADSILPNGWICLRMGDWEGGWKEMKTEIHSPIPPIHAARPGNRSAVVVQIPG